MKRPAFTLIELILVITIIGILVAFLILDFRKSLQRQEFSVVVDQAVALMQQARAEVTAGNRDADLNLLCRGGLFFVNRNPHTLSAPYNKTTEACDLDKSTDAIYGATSNTVVVDKVDVGGTQVKGLMALFEPPNGALVLYDQSGNRLAGDATLTLQHKRNPDLKLLLLLAPLSSQITLSKPNETP